MCTHRRVDEQGPVGIQAALAYAKPRARGAAEPAAGPRRLAVAILLLCLGLEAAGEPAAAQARARSRGRGHGQSQGRERDRQRDRQRDRHREHTEKRTDRGRESGASGAQATSRPSEHGDRRRLTAARLRRLEARFSHEPSIERVQRDAIRHALAGRARPRRWLRRARHAAWLPRLRLGLGGQQRRDRNLDREVGSASALRAGATHQIAYEIRMSWDLPRLIFDPNTLKVIREAQRITELREQVVTTVTRLYFERRRLQLQALIQPARRAQEAVRRRLRIAELTAALDALTGGRFRRALRAGRKR